MTAQPTTLDPAGRAAPGPGWRPLLPAMVLMAAMSAGYLALFPLVPAFQEEHGISLAAVGLLGAVGFLAAVVGELVLGPRADAGHTRALVAGAVVAMAVALAGHALAAELWQFVALRILGGLAFGAFVPAVNAEAIRAAPARAGEQLGRLQSADLLGLSVGPLLAALGLAVVGADTTLVVLGLLLLATVPLVGRLRSTPSAAGAAAHPGGLPVGLLRERRVAGAVVLTVAFMIPVGAYDALWPTFLDDLGGSAVLVGISYTVFALPFVVLAARAGRFADRVGGLRAAWSGMGVMLPMIVGYGVITSPLLVTGLGFLESGGQAYASTAAAAAVAHAVPAARAAAGQGLARASGTVVAAGVAAVAAPLYAWGGAGALFGATAAATLGAMLMATVVLRPVR
ncbi:MAG: MFS transporter [Microthrixaceae bacterium]